VDLRALGRRDRRRLAGQPRLADAWVAGDQHRPAPPPGGLVDPAPQRGQLGIPPDQRRRGHYELAADEPTNRRVAIVFDDLALAI
jgi:hypothetical protein